MRYLMAIGKDHDGTTTFFTVGSGPDLPSTFAATRDLAARRRRRRTPGRFATQTEAVLIEPDVHTHKAALLRAEALLDAFGPRIEGQLGPAGVWCT